MATRNPDNSKRRYTIYDIARIAGVSPSTVSRVINDKSNVRAETRNKVLAVLNDIDYYPNEMARSLLRKQSNTIALIVSDVSNPFFTAIARGVEDTASRNGFNVILCNTDEDLEEERAYCELCLRKYMDGVIISPVTTRAKNVKVLLDHLPVVLIDRKIPGLSREVDVVVSDNEKGAMTATEYLLSLGHTRIGLLLGPLDVTTSAERLAGYRKALEEKGITPDEDLIRSGRFDQSSGYQLTKELLALSPPPTAIFAANNYLALGALKALRKEGWRVPEDISLLCFDDIEIAAEVYPFLTVIAQQTYSLGSIACQMLIERITGRVTGKGRQIVLNTELITRQSTRPPARQSDRELAKGESKRSK